MYDAFVSLKQSPVPTVAPLKNCAPPHVSWKLKESVTRSGCASKRAFIQLPSCSEWFRMTCWELRCLPCCRWCVSPLRVAGFVFALNTLSQMSFECPGGALSLRWPPSLLHDLWSICHRIVVQDPVLDSTHLGTSRFWLEDETPSHCARFPFWVPKRRDAASSSCWRGPMSAAMIRP